jgi:hypothetical protein
MLKRFVMENWQAKLMSLVVATAVWYLIKKNVDSYPERWRLEQHAPVLPPVTR